jgi:hypothetical protein
MQTANSFNWKNYNLEEIDTPSAVLFGSFKNDRNYGYEG